MSIIPSRSTIVADRVWIWSDDNAGRPGLANSLTGYAAKGIGANEKNIADGEISGVKRVQVKLERGPSERLWDKQSDGAPRGEFIWASA
ncbi:predicted protein [Uncinocarpus reesii 1704]|uniref:Uncharacterized protein n=1 Tax=Uncinocarpus reesii (strain UAMH 1704) TaxID=336963 RepID=C4JFY3_UNCRE|nr:uncharacterized protein UREG_01063 [Uncinocarpus reesii 1704]EEP76214.1 predicted protein [Uncinocarpus reesii 1704]